MKNQNPTAAPSAASPSRNQGSARAEASGTRRAAGMETRTTAAAMQCETTIKPLMTMKPMTARIGATILRNVAHALQGAAEP